MTVNHVGKVCTESPCSFCVTIVVDPSLISSRFFFFHFHVLCVCVSVILWLSWLGDRSLLSILMGFSSACQAKEQHEVVAEVDTVAAWTSNQIFQVFFFVSLPWLDGDCSR